jgi:hypothetical protein
VCKITKELRAGPRGANGVILTSEEITELPSGVCEVVKTLAGGSFVVDILRSRYVSRYSRDKDNRTGKSSRMEMDLGIIDSIRS